MNIHEILYRIKGKFGKSGSVEVFRLTESGEVENYPFFRRFFLSMVILLVALASFGLGKLSGISRPPIQIRYESLQKPQYSIANIQANTAEYTITASSKGTKYYLPGCKNTISDKNKITFASAEIAEQAGYTLATTCK